MVGWAASVGLSCTRYAAWPWIWGIDIDFVWGCTCSFSREGLLGVGVSVVRGDGAVGYLLL